MEEIELNEERRQVLWRIEAEQAGKDVLGWKMLENNVVSGILPFDYYYVDSWIYFRCTYHSLQRFVDYFNKKEGDFETLCFVCSEVLRIVERGREYLLKDSGYLLLPQWIFWSRFERKLSVCYFPGREGEIAKDYIAFLEYLMQHINHKEQKAVTLIYGLYDIVASEGFLPEHLLQYIQEVETGIQKNSDSISGQPEEFFGSSVATPQIQAQRKVSQESPSSMYYLIPLQDKKTSKLQRELLCEKSNRYPVMLEETVIGRKESCELCLPFGTISRRHAVLSCEEGKLFVMDVASKNGTYLNGNKISAYVKTCCKENDVLTFADISYQIGNE